MISLILWVIAPIFNAIMDLVENENFYQSIFYRKTNSILSSAPEDQKREYNKKMKWNNWWYKRVSWQTKYKFFGYKFDAWHIAKSIMIILMVISSVLQIYFEGLWIHWTAFVFLNASIEVIAKGLIWNVVFSIFYNFLFRSKTWAK